MGADKTKGFDAKRASKVCARDGNRLIESAAAHGIDVVVVLLKEGHETAVVGGVCPVVEVPFGWVEPLVLASQEKARWELRRERAAEKARWEKRLERAAERRKKR